MDDDSFFSLNFNKRSNKIIKIVAGNGNQFFQYALGLMIEKYIGVDVYFDYSSYGCNGIQSSPRYCFNGKTYGRNRPLRLNLFNISNKKIATQDMINKATPIPESTIIEQGFKALNNGENQKLSGFFETNKIYDFDDPENLKIFRENFALKDGIKDESDIELLKNIRDADSVSIHFRKTDHVRLSDVPLSYYTKAMDYIKSKIPNLIYFVFSDDLNWVKNNVNFNSNYTFVTHGKNGHLDIELMKNCKHNIIAPSTFSFWAAELNENKNKIVIAPMNHNPNGKQSQPVYPKSWVLLSD